MTFYGRKLSRDTLLFNSGYVLHTLIFCQALVFCGDEWNLPHQIILILATFTLSFSLVLHAGSELWIDRMVRYQYNFNESVIIMAIMFHYWFSEHVDDFDLRIEIGNAYIVMVQTCIVMNSGFAVHKVV